MTPIKPSAPLYPNSPPPPFCPHLHPAPSRKGNHNHVRDAHTKGPRGSRPAKISGGHTSRGGGAGGRAPNQGGERRQFERRSGALPDSQKKIEQGWGANEGAAELSGELCLGVWVRCGLEGGGREGKKQCCIVGQSWAEANGETNKGKVRGLDGQSLSARQ